MRTGTVVVILIIALVIIAGGIYYFSNDFNSAATSTPTTTQQTSATITFPAGGETLVPGQSYTLLWNGQSEADATSTQIFLLNTALESQGESVAISDRVYGVPDTGSYFYTVPANMLSGTYTFEIGTLRSNSFQIASTTTP